MFVYIYNRDAQNQKEKKQNRKQKYARFLNA